MMEFRCKKCNKLLARYKECREMEIKCPRCGTSNVFQQKELSSRKTAI